MKIQLPRKNLKNNLLECLSAPGINLIEDRELTERVKKTIETSEEISISREVYHRVAGLAALFKN
jgi:hypothetical protein